MLLDINMNRITYYFQFGLYIDQYHPHSFAFQEPVDEISKVRVISLLMKEFKDEKLEITCIRYYDRSIGGWVLFEDNAHVRKEVIGDHLELAISLKDPQMYFQSAVKDLRNQIADEDRMVDEMEMDRELQTNLDLKQSRFSYMESTVYEEDAGLDVAYLYSNPVSHEDKDLYEPMDYKTELRCLVTTLENSQKRLSLKVDVLTEENLRNIITEQPKILHLSCQSAYDTDGSFYLYFEHHISKGKLVKINSEALQDIFFSSPKASLSLVVISTSHSDDALDLFSSMNLNIPIVTIHSNPLWYDDECQKFIDTFYTSLIENLTVRKSFDTAKSETKVRGINNYHYCCCFHKHTESCQWKKIAMKNNETAHLVHLITCSCNIFGSHFHGSFSSECNDVYSTFNNNCCCNPKGIRHNNESKFQIRSEDDYDERLIFEGNAAIGYLQKSFKSFLDISLPAGKGTQVISKGGMFYSILQNIHCYRLITISGNGKVPFACSAGIYLYERNFFSSVYYMKLESRLSDIEFIQALNETLGVKFQVDSLKAFANIIDRDILLIIHLKQNDASDFQQSKFALTQILDNSQRLKIMLISSNQIGNVNVNANVIELGPFDDNNSFKFFFELTKEILLNNCSVDSIKRLLKFACGDRKKIILFANSLKDRFQNARTYKKIDISQRNNFLLEIIEQTENDTLNTDELLKQCIEKSPIDKELLFTFLLFPKGIILQDFIRIFEYNRSLYERSKQDLIFLTLSEMYELGSVYKKIRRIFIESSEKLCIDFDKELKVRVYDNLLNFHARQCVNFVLFVRKFISFTEFTAAQNSGIWEISTKASGKNEINNPKHFQWNYDSLKIFIENKNILYEIYKKNPDNFQKNIELLSICVPTILMHLALEDNTKHNKSQKECYLMIKLYQQILFDFQFFKAYARILLLETYIMNRLPDPNEKFDSDANMIHAKKYFDSCNYQEGLAEVSFLQTVLQMRNYSQMKIEITECKLNQCTQLLEDAICMYDPSSLEYARACVQLAKYNIKYKLSHKISSCDLTRLENALKVFNAFERPFFACKALILISKWHYLGADYNEALSSAKNSENLAKTLPQDNKTKELLKKLDILITELNNKIRTKLNNVLVFLYENALIPNTQFIVSHQSNLFHEINRIAESHKEILFTFDILSKNSFETEIQRGGRVLFLFSSSLNPGNSLMVEDESGQAGVLEANTIIENLILHKKSLFDLVIILNPLGRELAEVFVKAGVRHVICFSFSSEALRYFQKLIKFPLFNYLNEFALNLADKILAMKTLQEAFKLSKEEYLGYFKKIRDEIYFNKCDEDIINTISPMLIPENDENIDHDIILFIQTNRAVTETSNFQYKIAKTVNIHPRKWPLISKKGEMLDCLHAFEKESIYVNLYGEEGIGKTTIARELGHYLSFRQLFPSGIFFFDVHDITTVDQLRELLKQNNIEKENIDLSMLIILDNCDNIAKLDRDRFFWFLLDYEKDTFAIFLMTSREKILTNFNKVRHIEVTPLDDIQSAYLFLSYCRRKIHKCEVESNNDDWFDETSNLFTKISCHQLLKACNGIPRYLKLLARRAKKFQLSKINENEIIQKKVNSQKKGHLTETFHKWVKNPQLMKTLSSPQPKRCLKLNNIIMENEQTVLDKAVSFFQSENKKFLI